MAYQELLQEDPKGLMKDGSYEFKKRFSALSRAGELSVFYLSCIWMHVHSLFMTSPIICVVFYNFLFLSFF